MKKIIACIPLLALLMLTGCEKRLFHFVSTINQSPTFTFDNTGPFSQRIVITSDRIKAALDVPSDGRITGVDIESLSLRVVVKPGNVASALSVTGATINSSGQRKVMFQNYPVPLVAVNAPIIGLNELIADGISELRGKLNGYVKDIDNTSFVIEVSGNSTLPAPGQRVVIDLNLVIKATVKYDQCVDVPQLFSSGEECTEK
jgi:hypothetical protein